MRLFLHSEGQIRESQKISIKDWEKQISEMSPEERADEYLRNVLVTEENDPSNDSIGTSIVIPFIGFGTGMLTTEGKNLSWGPAIVFVLFCIYTGLLWIREKSSRRRAEAAVKLEIIKEISAKPRPSEVAPAKADEIKDETRAAANSLYLWERGPETW